LEQGWTLVTDSPIEINGRAGRTMRLQKNVSGTDENLQATMVKEWPAIYLLTIIGPRDSSAWSGITDALSQSIEVK
jgi:hypothetical protein